MVCLDIRGFYELAIEVGNTDDDRLGRALNAIGATAGCAAATSRAADSTRTTRYGAVNGRQHAGCGSGRLLGVLILAGPIVMIKILDLLRWPALGQGADGSERSVRQLT